MNDLYTLVYGQATLYGMVLAGLYGFLAWQAWRNALAGHKQGSLLENALLYAAVAQHVLLLLGTVWLPTTQDNTVLALGYAQALSLASCVGMCLFILEERWVQVYTLRPVALLLPAAATALAAWVPPVIVSLPPYAALHVICAIAAHGLALLACGHALLLYSLNRLLKQSHAQGWLAALSNHSPPLVVLERLLIRLCLWTAGLLALTVILGTLNGLMRFDHKTILTLFSLLVWVSVWWGYEKRGWRATRLGLTVGFATGLLLLAYIGSRFVLQTLLHRL